jgi:hypothetical protein
MSYIPVTRLVSLAFTVYFIYLYFSIHEWLPIVGVVIAFSLFLLSGWFDWRWKARARELNILEEINRQEIRAMEGDSSGFDPGTDFISEAHPYTRDLDIFGEGSVFQYINRSATRFGRNRLAWEMEHAYELRGDIQQRQEAVRELAEMVDFRHQIRLLFSGQETTDEDKAALERWLGGQPMKRIALARVIMFGCPVLTILAIGSAIAGLIAYPFPVAMVVIQLMVVGIYGKVTMKVHAAVSGNFRIIEKYARFIELISGASVTSRHLKGMQLSLKSSKGAEPGKVIRRLATLLNRLDTNLNLLVSVLLNGLFMFNLHVLVAVERWRSQHREELPRWFSVMAGFDALAGLANYACNNPEYVYPEQTEGAFLFDASEMGHPLIGKGQCVTNSFEIKGWKQLCIITGANMSGKSTFLRTIGTNCMLAMLGAPVFAARFRFTPVEIHSSVRTTDSLAKKESYFYAELKRLKEIITGLEQGQRKFILLDEILKGTNSKDKQSGSIALVRQLMNYEMAGIIATHDLVLGELSAHFPENITNRCFEISISGDRMEIDYKIRDGVCRNLNATYLMKNMGILIGDAAGEPRQEDLDTAGVSSPAQ